MTLAILLAGGLLAFVNGANDVSKGIATLVGSGVASARSAILWGAAWTAVGGGAASVLTGAMVTAFGSGLLAPGTSPTFAAALASLVGAGGWVLLATRTGLPVSTTHALVGALAGVGAIAYGLDGVAWGPLGGKILLPLLVSPLAASALGAVLLRATRPGPGHGPALPAPADCLCAEVVAVPLALAGGAAVPGAARLQLAAAPAAACAVERPGALRLTLDHLHWVTSAATSLARALNDAPKIAALVLAAAALGGGALPASTTFAAVTLAMVAGSLVGGRRVTAVLAGKITRLDHREGFVANLVTAALVGAGAVGGLPMSTTHVAAGGIVGAGLSRGGGALDPGTLRQLAAAWLVTVPASAALGICAFALLRWGR